MHSLGNNSNNSSDSESDLIKLRVQYVADTDPFTCLSMFPIPTRPVQYSFLLVTPLVHQMNNLIKVLNAPQRVSEFIKDYVDISCQFLSKDIFS